MNNNVDNRVSEEISAAHKLLVTPSPHFKSPSTTPEIMQDVVIALIPAALVSCVYFGWRSALTIAVCIISCVLSEFICRKVMKRRQTVSDWSAVVTGMILAFCLPPTINPLYAAFGSIVAIVVVKQMFGGIGMNFANPAATARIVLMLSFPAAMSTYVNPFFYLNKDIDAVSSATPLVSLQSGEAAPGVLTLLFGNTPGCLGETCAAALILGGLFLIFRGVIKPTIPLCFIGTVAVISFLVGFGKGYNLEDSTLYMLSQLLSGGLMLGAIFMATDYTTSPITNRGKIVFAIGCGVLTMAMRLLCNMPEGVSYAILLMNILVPHIEKLTTPKPFGEEKEVAA